MKLIRPNTINDAALVSSTVAETDHPVWSSATTYALGARVIKVERTGSGDDTRGWGPPFASDGESAYFLSTNRNKLSLAADFTAPDDVELLHALIADADIVIENFLPGVLARYGLDADTLLARNERLLWCTISGFGPESRRPGYDCRRSSGKARFTCW